MTAAQDEEGIAPGGSGDDLPSAGPLSFYDGLRERVVHFVAAKGGDLGPHLASALLLVPDVFVLLARLSIDPRVPRRSRALVASALAYAVLPLDLFPELALGPGGYVDDLVLALAVLAQAFGDDLEPYAAAHWSGSQPLRRVISDGLTSARSLLGAGLYERLRRVLARRGVELGSRP